MQMTGRTLESINKNGVGRVLTKDGKEIEASSPFALAPVSKWVVIEGEGNQWEIVACEC